MTVFELEQFAHDIRTEIVKAIGKKGGGHIGGSLSIADLIAVLYGEIMSIRPKEPDWDGRDYLVCSKGHAGPALYAALGLLGFFPMDWLNYLNIAGSNLPGHCDRLKVPGIDATTGSLGQGLSIATGIAHALKIQGRESQKVFCIVGDGETAEGQIWEAMEYAAHYQLSNLIMFLDWNKMQIDGSNDDVLKLGDIKMKYAAFGFETQLINGHDIQLLLDAIDKAVQAPTPSAVILDTIKGHGVKCISGLSNNHCIGMSKELTEQALSELQAALHDSYKSL